MVRWYSRALASGALEIGVKLETSGTCAAHTRRIRSGNRRRGTASASLASYLLRTQYMARALARALARDDAEAG